MAQSATISYAWLGESGALWIAIALTGVALDRPRRTAWLRMAAAVPAALTANYAVKLIVRRPDANDRRKVRFRRAFLDLFTNGSLRFSIHSGCGPYRTRTGHLIHAMDALYQMS